MVDAKLMTAKYAGKCSVCGMKIEPGTPIYWEKNTKAVYHEQCPDKALFPTEKEEEEEEWP